jgi:hypothetical protein
MQQQRPPERLQHPQKLLPMLLQVLQLRLRPALKLHPQLHSIIYLPKIKI